MRVDAFDFDLPAQSIALRPAVPRDTARLLVVNPDAAPPISDHVVTELANFLQPGDALVFNQTRVIAAELTGLRRRGDNVAAISITLHKRDAIDRWQAFARPAKRLKPGDRLVFGTQGTACEASSLEATVGDRHDGGLVDLIFDLAGPDLDFAIASHGRMPLPPYIASKRDQDARDQSDYQTIYAREEGAVAAPTAGLHFTDAIMKGLDARGIERHFLTLHVGAGTFLPVKADDTDDHQMHAEWGRVDADAAMALNAVRARGNRVVAVGTTSLRLLESATNADGKLEPFDGDTDIFITPGYAFRFVDALMTNFHLPRSTLFMLVSAFAGTELMAEAYRHAIDDGYRFYSYGDASLLFLGNQP